MFRRCWARRCRSALSRCQRHGGTDRGVRRLGGRAAGVVARHHRVLHQAVQLDGSRLCRCKFRRSRRPLTGRSAQYIRGSSASAPACHPAPRPAAAEPTAATEPAAATCASSTGRGRRTGKASTRQAHSRTNRTNLVGKVSKNLQPGRPGQQGTQAQPGRQGQPGQQAGQAGQPVRPNLPGQQNTQGQQAPRVNTDRQQGQPSLQGQPNQQQQSGAPRGPGQKLGKTCAAEKNDQR